MKSTGALIFALMVWTAWAGQTTNPPPTQITFISISGTPSPYIPAGYVTNGLVAWWMGTNGSGTNVNDSSGNGVVLPLVGNPAWGMNYFTLNGTNQVGDAGSNALTSVDMQDKTVCFWINPSGLNTNLQGIIGKFFANPDGTYGGWAVNLESNNILEWQVRSGLNQDTSGVLLLPKQWNFASVVWSYSTDTAYFYINGSLDFQSGPISSQLEKPSSFAHLLVGNQISYDNSGASNLFAGSIHDIAVYNRQLSCAEIQANFLNSAFTTNVDYPGLLYLQMTAAEAAQTNNLTSIALADYSSQASGSLPLVHGFTGGSPPSIWFWNTNLVGAPTALHFNGGNSYLTTSNTASFNFTNQDFTINTWLHPYSSGGVIMGNGNYGTNGWSLNVGGSYTVYFASETNGTESTVYTEPSTVSPTAWHMVTVVRSGGLMCIYIDGLGRAYTSNFTSPAAGASPLILGSNPTLSPPNTNPPFYDGDMWLDQVWGEALQPADVAGLYLNQKMGVPFP